MKKQTNQQTNEKENQTNAHKESNSQESAIGQLSPLVPQSTMGSLPATSNNQGLRQSNVMQMQRQQGNNFVQRRLASTSLDLGRMSPSMMNQPILQGNGANIAQNMASQNAIQRAPKTNPTTRNNPHDGGPGHSGVNQTGSGITAVEYNAGMKTLQGQMVIYDADPGWGRTDMATVIFIVRLGRVSWMEYGKPRSAFVVDKVQASASGVATGLKAAPQLSVEHRVVQGHLHCILTANVQIAGPKVTTNVSFNGSAELNVNAGIKMTEEANSGVLPGGKVSGEEVLGGAIKAAGSFTCGRTTELNGAEVQCQRGMTIVNASYNNNATLYMSPIGSASFNPVPVRIEGFDEWESGAHEVTLETSGALFNQATLS